MTPRSSGSRPSRGPRERSGPGIRPSRARSGRELPSASPRPADRRRSRVPQRAGTVGASPARGVPLPARRDSKSGSASGPVRVVGARKRFLKAGLLLAGLAALVVALVTLIGSPDAISALRLSYFVALAGYVGATLADAFDRHLRYLEDRRGRLKTAVLVQMGSAAVVLVAAVFAIHEAAL